MEGSASITGQRTSSNMQIHIPRDIHSKDNKLSLRNDNSNDSAQRREHSRSRERCDSDRLGTPKFGHSSHSPHNSHNSHNRRHSNNSPHSHHSPHSRDHSRSRSRSRSGIDRDHHSPHSRSRSRSHNHNNSNNHQRPHSRSRSRSRSNCNNNNNIKHQMVRSMPNIPKLSNQPSQSQLSQASQASQSHSNIIITNPNAVALAAINADNEPKKVSDEEECHKLRYRSGIIGIIIGVLIIGFALMTRLYFYYTMSGGIACILFSCIILSKFGIQDDSKSDDNENNGGKTNTINTNDIVMGDHRSKTYVPTDSSKPVGNVIWTPQLQVPQYSNSNI